MAKSNGAEPLLAMHGVFAGYGGILALRGVSVEVFPGEIVTLIGSNGAGKSTTLRTISGLVRPREGSITFEGKRVDHLPPHRIVGMGVSQVPEGRGIFARLSVRENLELGAYLRPKADLKEDYERVYELFPLLYERRAQLAGTLSGGEQQMVAMGRALMSRPRLLLMDEPSMGLAPILVERSFEIIKQVHESGVAMLVVEQNANVSLSIADRGYVLSTGRVVLEGKAADLLQNEDLRKAYLGR
jgi:branched-chain amino acid transport system ATP-binding protein